MGYRVKRIQALEEEKLKINKEKDYWHREAIRLAAELGELKIKLGEFIESNT